MSKMFTSEPLYVVTRPFGVTPHDGDPAFNGGFLNGPFRDRTAAENACTAAMGTGKFFQAAILTDAEVSEVRKAHREEQERKIEKEELRARVCDRARKMFGDSYGTWLSGPNAALEFQTPLFLIQDAPEKVSALLDRLEAEGEKP